ncbi:lysylphosphatidylglycerol synthase transmembrane domain-containing protein [Rhizomonospora bruguierae]|uniref:lysylphosphatidylglycerol synthase transmembrane domain-containing protein n=1 Tax=Rhizomonospora bruguierae TaxID=1581705 RepID=UPI001BCDD72E|nr:lysylphosphatidylglycerol synthase transmembrane domain-containing protein [Micromonospora sp. NBRC 107566]
MPRSAGGWLPPPGTVWTWARVLGGAGILGLLLWRLGTGAFLDGLRVIDGRALLVAFGIGLATTVFSAWRWCLVARGLGLRLPLAAAVADYYRSLFLNAALPGGVLGDVHRAVRHGRESGDVGRGLRAVVLERSAGQVVLVTFGLAVLVAYPSPVQDRLRLAAVAPYLAGAVTVAGLVAAVIVWRRRGAARRGTAAHTARPGNAACTAERATATRAGQRETAAHPGRHGTAGHPAQRGDRGEPAGRWARAVRTAGADVRRGLLTRRTAPGILVASALVVAGHLGTFLVAARAAGSVTPITRLLPLMLLALLAMTLPLNIGGWGPREGVTAWAFGAAGLSATQGLTIAVVYGLFAFVASLPGAGVLVARWLRGSRRSRTDDRRVDTAAGPVA